MGRMPSRGHGIAAAGRPIRLKRLVGLIVQGAKFGGVGGLATLTHVGMFTMLIELFGIAPVIANFIAFSVAVGVSFVGHFYWTFSAGRRSGREFRAAFLKFVVVALTGLGLNSLAVYVIDEVLMLPYVYAIAVMVLVVPAVVFVLSKYWAFAPR